MSVTFSALHITSQAARQCLKQDGLIRIKWKVQGFVRVPSPLDGLDLEVSADEAEHHALQILHSSKHFIHLMYVIQQSSRCRTPGDALCLEDAAVFAAYILEVMQYPRMTHMLSPTSGMRAQSSGIKHDSTFAWHCAANHVCREASQQFQHEGRLPLQQVQHSKAICTLQIGAQEICNCFSKVNSMLVVQTCTR